MLKPQILLLKVLARGLWILKQMLECLDFSLQHGLWFLGTIWWFWRQSRWFFHSRHLLCQARWESWWWYIEISLLPRRIALWSFYRVLSQWLLSCFVWWSRPVVSRIGCHLIWDFYRVVPIQPILSSLCKVLRSCLNAFRCESRRNMVLNGDIKTSHEVATWTGNFSSWVWFTHPDVSGLNTRE